MRATDGWMSDAKPPQSPSSLEDEALAWVVRLHSGHASEQDHRACEAWKNVSPSHRQAFREALTLWEEIGAVGTTRRLLSQNIHQADSRSRGRLHRLRKWSLVACILVAIGGFFWESLHFQLRLQTAQHRTAVGQQEQIVLQDGSQLMLNTDTALDVVFSPERREVHLLKGEAAFVVAPDSTRSFTVRSQGTDTTALGTKFVVQTRNDFVTVTVLEHAVQVSSQNQPTASYEVLREGQQISYSTDAGWSPTRSVDANQMFAWQRGKMIFQAQPLGTVVADLNRYRHGHIFILNPSLRTLPVTGVFEIDDPDGALRIIEQTLAIRDTNISPYFVFLH